MDSPLQGGSPGLPGLASLRKFIRPRPAKPAQPAPERCELCDEALADDHSHMVELASRRLVCACEACALLFSNHSAGKYRRVPRRSQFLPDFRLTDEAWEELHLPINLTFFLHSTPAGRVVALYPSPAGATESLIALESWQALVEANPILRDFEPDVEALLVNRVGRRHERGGPTPPPDGGGSPEAETRECYRVGIDHCYKLVGLIRTHWRGLSGGPGVWDEIGRFFTGLKERSTRGTSHA